MRDPSSQRPTLYHSSRRPVASLPIRLPTSIARVMMTKAARRGSFDFGAEMSSVSRK
jgi:hypothetical protein